MAAETPRLAVAQPFLLCGGHGEDAVGVGNLFSARRGGKFRRSDWPWRRIGGGERRGRWTSSVGEVSGAQWHELHRTEEMSWDLLNGEMEP
jgi:hypothetical protein